MKKKLRSCSGLLPRKHKTILFDDRSMILFKEGFLKDGGNDDEASNEKGIKHMSAEKDLSHFLEYFLLSPVSRIISLLREVYFLSTEMSVAPDERIDGNLQEDGNSEKVR